MAASKEFIETIRRLQSTQHALSCRVVTLAGTRRQLKKAEADLLIATENYESLKKIAVRQQVELRGFGDLRQAALLLCSRLDSKNKRGLRPLVANLRERAKTFNQEVG